MSKATDTRRKQREELKRIREKELRAERLRRNGFRWAVAVLVAAFIAVVAVLVVVGNSKMNAEREYTKGEQLTPTVLQDDGSLRLDKDGGVTKSTDEAPRRMDLVFDLHCPACKMVDENLRASWESKMSSGELAIYLHPAAILNSQSSDDYSARAGSALMTVAENSPEHTWAYMEALYDNQPSEGAGYRPVTDAKLSQLAKDVGVDEATADAILEEHYVEWMNSNTTALGKTPFYENDSLYTPGVFLDGTVKDDVVVNATAVSFDSDIVGDFEKAYAKGGK